MFLWRWEWGCEGWLPAGGFCVPPLEVIKRECVDQLLQKKLM